MAMNSHEAFDKVIKAACMYAELSTKVNANEINELMLKLNIYGKMKEADELRKALDDAKIKI